MTLKTLKPKVNNSLILDDEFLEYCRINNVVDIQKLAREVFNKGFTILKYGEKLPDLKPIEKSEKVTPINPHETSSVIPPVENKKKEKDNIYEE